MSKRCLSCDRWISVFVFLFIPFSLLVLLVVACRIEIFFLGQLYRVFMGISSFLSFPSHSLISLSKATSFSDLDFFGVGWDGLLRFYGVYDCHF